MNSFFIPWYWQKKKKKKTIQINILLFYPFVILLVLCSTCFLHGPWRFWNKGRFETYDFKNKPKFTYYIHSLSSKNNDFPRDFNFIILHVIMNKFPNLHGSPFTWFDNFFPIFFTLHEALADFFNTWGQ